ncbi:MAG: hypothetical protein EP334_07870 [Gammaproteobacteria bacterium]|nr:MAG: hypothetical protein EP334_07870 [Gammaproteobacteria bacterium]
MDLQDFESQVMYFDLEASQEVDHLLRLGAERYAEGEAEGCLLQAYALAPNNLTVLVALYRFYYYQHRYQDALMIADRAMETVAPIVGFPASWVDVDFADLAAGLLESFTMVRFYLLALKGAAYLNFRLGNVAEGVRMLNKVIELDSNDRLGAKALLHSIGPAAVA